MGIFVQTGRSTKARTSQWWNAHSEELVPQRSDRFRYSLRLLKPDENTPVAEKQTNLLVTFVCQFWHTMREIISAVLFILHENRDKGNK